MAEKKHYIVGKHEAGERLDRVVPRAFEELSRHEARKRISAGEIWLNGRAMRVQSRPLRSGDRITWLEGGPSADGRSEKKGRNKKGNRRKSDQPLSDAEVAKERRRARREVDWEVHGGEPEVVFHDRSVVVLNKPSGYPVEPTPKEDLRTCLRQVEAWQRQKGVHPTKMYATAVHRLDAATSGLTVFAVRKFAARHLSEQFARKEPHRTYMAVVIGVPEERKGRLVHHLAHTGPGLRRGVVKEGKGKWSALRYEVVETFDDRLSLLKVELETGRTHQIRVQLSHIGHPIVGDWMYCPKDRAQEVPRSSRMLLHAMTLEVKHPSNDQPIRWEVPLPENYQSYLETNFQYRYEIPVEVVSEEEPDSTTETVEEE